MIRTIIGIVVVFFGVTLAWMILGGTVMERSYSQDRQLRKAVEGLWGSPHTQVSPSVWYETEEERREELERDGMRETRIRKHRERHPVTLAGSEIVVHLDLEHRRKGLLWYPTYTVDFSGTYRFVNETGSRQAFQVSFPLPNAGGVYDAFRCTINGERRGNVPIEAGAISTSVKLEPGETGTVEVSYRSQGLESWMYEFGEGVSRVRGFSLRVQTGFDGFNFPDDSLSPTSREQSGHNWTLDWQYDDLISGVRAGVVMPEKVNPGPFVGRVTFFAPVSLFLFFFVVFMITVHQRIRLHPMHYFFLGCAFFSFHLLLAYLVDHVAIPLSFIVSSLVSLGLSISYIRLVAGFRFALIQIGLAQLVYLVLFSAAFFLPGYTGLSITACCILTLFIVMQMTGRTDWHSVGQRFNNEGK